MDVSDSKERVWSSDFYLVLVSSRSSIVLKLNINDIVYIH